MTYFDETAQYWGDRVAKILGAGNDRLTVRSVKIFADGECHVDLFSPFVCTFYSVHVFTGALRSGGAAVSV